MYFLAVYSYVDIAGRSSAKIDDLGWPWTAISSNFRRFFSTRAFIHAQLSRAYL